MVIKGIGGAGSADRPDANKPTKNFHQPKSSDLPTSSNLEKVKNLSSDKKEAVRKALNTEPEIVAKMLSQLSKAKRKE